MRSLMLLACLWSGSAFAEVDPADWPGFVGQEVRLVNPAGKQIDGTLLSANGDEVVIRRERDGREFTIPKDDVDSCVLLNPPTAKKVVGEAAKKTREAAGEVVVELDQEADKAVEKAGGVVERVGEKMQGPAEIPDDPELAAPAQGPPVEGGQAAADADAPELERPVLAEGRTYADGLRAGQLEAGERRMLQPFAVSAGATCATTSLCIPACGPVGACVGVAGGAAGPIYYAAVRPYTIKDELALEVKDEPTEFAAGYVRGYTDELQRKETIMSTAGSVAGLVAGALVGGTAYVLWLNYAGSL
jgi:hypothetical protein